MRRAIRKHLGDFIAIVVLFVLGVGIAGYILSNQRLRFPVIQEAPLRIKAVLPDAQAVTPGQGQTVRVAGVEVGAIGKVELEDGRAVVELEMETEHKGLIRRDATALLRSKTGLKDMFIEVDPGDGEPLREGQRITIRNTLPDVDPDEIFSALDEDTRDYLQLLISGAGKGLEGRGTDLRETLRRFGPIHRDLARFSKAVARRRRNMRRLVNRYGLLVRELGTKDRELTRLVRASNEVFASFAAEDENVSRFVARLPGTLRQTESTLVKVDELGQRLGPALTALRPAFRRLDEANRAVLPLAREATPIVRDQIRPFARASGPFTEDIGVAARDLSRANPDLTRSLRGLNRFFNIGAYNPGGSESITPGCENDGDCSPEERARNEGYLYWLAWVAQNTVSLFNTADAQGPFRRLTLGAVNCSIFTAELETVEEQIPGLTDLLGKPLVQALGEAQVCAD